MPHSVGLKGTDNASKVLTDTKTMPPPLELTGKEIMTSSLGLTDP